MSPLMPISSNGSVPMILVVEDSVLTAQVMCEGIEKVLGWHTVVAGSFEEAKILLEKSAHRFFAAVVDLTLPDIVGQEHVDYITEAGVPTIILTASYDQKLRDSIILKPKIVDYFIKTAGVIETCTNLLARLWRNKTISVLIVDDSLTQRKYIAKLLRRRLFKIEFASDAEEALSILEQDTDRLIRLALVDYHMPKMNGDELVVRIRNTQSKEELAIIGMSMQEGGLLSVHFLKSGASDFIRTPFTAEELFCRVDQSLDINETLVAVRHAANRDPLTQLYNRRYFSEVAGTFHSDALCTNISMGIALFDIDHFKKINDTYGHAAGDAALCHLAQLLMHHLRETDVVARWGGEEFCVMLANLSPDAAFRTIERLRQAIENTSFVYDGQELLLTVSTGLTMNLGDSLETMVSAADDLMYQAKQSGRNKIIMAESQEFACPTPSSHSD